ncbi:MAG: hypothetical protein ABIV28_01460 [Longimicrobiales bacterium]
MSVRTRKTVAMPSIASLKFSAINGIFLGLGLTSITAGYVLLSNGSTVAAPLLLVLGYAILVPLGIIL